ncbi:MAG: hypothetical protein CVU71_16210 [Deltaproteobacteria bacterium HGW-Deltaproteobacteria-6]|jgi:glycosyltransferase involved in cell wall biosynthesis|nr:MAG: hypothetical protein CVU71_16210 [Deltaproteobacteria bacterium HGW-Deltaproteobacteria-6]
MRIGIDSRFAVMKRRGIGNYTLNLIRNLAEIDSANQYILYTDRDDSDRVLPMQANFRVSKLLPSNYPMWEQIILPMQVKKDCVDILHCSGNTAPVLLNKRTKLISTIHDVMYLKDSTEMAESPSLYQRAGRVYRKAIVTRSAKRLAMAITVSKYSKNDIRKHITGLRNEDIRITYEAADACFRTVSKAEAAQKIKNRFKMTGDYIMTLGAVDPRKNTELVIREFINLKKELSIKEKLLIAGVPDWRQTRLFRIARDSNYSDDIAFLDFVSMEELVLLYNAAKVFLYPSLYEGFGIPPLEAMACGVPVITSNTTSIPEVVGDAALLIDPTDGQALRCTLVKLLGDKALREELADRGVRQAHKFSWRKMAEETLKTYEEVYRVH